MNIPQKQVSEPVVIFDCNKVIEEMISAITNILANKKSARYCWKSRDSIGEETDYTGLASMCASEVKESFEAKGWTVEVEDLSELDGTIVFQVS